MSTSTLERLSHHDTPLEELPSSIREAKLAVKALDNMSQEFVHNPQTDITITDIAHTADLVAHTYEEELITKKKVEIGVVTVWAALHAWNSTRVPETEKLAVLVLNDFKATSQPTFVQAFMEARKSKKDIDKVLDEINDRERYAKIL